MATLALSLAGQFVGGLFGPVGATVGRALGALAGSAVDSMLFGDKPQVAGSDVRLQGSSEGGGVPRLYGWSRVAGNIIWARELELIGGAGSGSKGFGGDEASEEVAASFAVALCEGPVSRLGRIWADGQLLDTRGLTLRFHRGDDTQLPDGLIEATQGEAPAYRGVAYLVVERLPLGPFGNRIPQLTVELCRTVGELERDIRAITEIPGATEFGYDPVARVRLVGPGETAAENSHLVAGVSDWTWSIDELCDLCPNLEHVAVVVSWFGDDLRCGQCAISPRVEGRHRQVEGSAWSVMGLGRDDVPVVTRHGGGAAYGGTPSDAAVLAAIADLRARGLKVTLYPLVMMDIPEGNGLPDPRGAAEQAAYPWRGRITCHPAPGMAGSPDGTPAAAAQVAAFVPGYRQMVLHYASLAAQAGVDAFVIGSEMVGLTTVRGAGNSFPFVEALVTLAGDVRTLAGPAMKLTYAADWTEWSGYQPGEGEKFFHLDPLWASPAIDAVGIDNYMPLADWREGTAHLDAAAGGDGYGLDYLAGNIAGGEGHDWFYASRSDRHAQVRTPITDGDHGEPWVWRFKDIRNWWSHAHHDRPGGVRQGTPTAWVAGMKPVWFTELGCGAIDKGANQPNIFGDPKSGENGLPYHSTGLPDPLIQRQLLRAHHRFWRDPANNPAGMVDVGRIYCWTWDARPYPAFPGLEAVWSDGPNHRNGHWLTGRLGGMAADELIAAMAADHGVTVSAVAGAPLVSGTTLAGPTTAREALEPVLEATGLRLRATPAGLVAEPARREAAMVLDPEALVAGEGPVMSRRRPDPAEMPGRLALSFLDRERDYLVGAVTALVGEGSLATEQTGLVLDAGSARLVAERLLDARSGRRETLEFELPPDALALEPGDVVAIAGMAEGPFEIEAIRDGAARRVTTRTLPVGGARATGVDRPVSGGAGVPVKAMPVALVAQLPPVAGDPLRSRLAVAAYADPWPGPMRLVDETTGAMVMDLGRASIGMLEAALGPGPVTVWDEHGTVDLTLRRGHLASVTDMAALAGSNRIAVRGDAGGWEIIGFARAALVAPGRYRLSRLLRGLDATRPAMAAAGNEVMVLDARVGILPLEQGELGETRSLRLFAGRDDLAGTPVIAATESSPALPLPPVHLRARSMGGDVVVSWVRTSRADGGLWGAAEVPLEHGGGAVPAAHPRWGERCAHRGACRDRLHLHRCRATGRLRRGAGGIRLHGGPAQPGAGRGAPGTGRVPWLRRASTSASRQCCGRRAGSATTRRTRAGQRTWGSPAAPSPTGAGCPPGRASTWRR